MNRSMGILIANGLTYFIFKQELTDLQKKTDSIGEDHMKTFSKSFLTGLATILPITLTLYLLYWFVYSAESFLGGIFRWLLPAHWYLPGLGMVAGVLLIFVVSTLMQALSGMVGVQERIAVYLPMSYQIGGYTVLVPKAAVEPLNMSLEEAKRFVLTAGIVNSHSGIEK